MMIYHISLSVIGLMAIILSVKDNTLPIPLIVAYCSVLLMKLTESILSKEDDKKLLFEAQENIGKLSLEIADLRGQFNILRNFVGSDRPN